MIYGKPWAVAYSRSLIFDPESVKVGSRYPNKESDTSSSQSFWVVLLLKCPWIWRLKASGRESPLLDPSLAYGQFRTGQGYLAFP